MSFVAGTQLPTVRIGPITLAQVQAFARQSGDDNPLHTDGAVARRAGLAAPPVPGMQLVAWLHAAVQRGVPGSRVTGFSTRFLAPVAIGETIAVSGRIVKAGAGGDEAVMRLFIHTAAGEPACMAEANLVRA